MNELAEQTKWAESMWGMLADGGVWGVPRSGLMYRKDGNSLVLYARMPWEEGMPLTREELQEQQDDDHRGIVVLFTVIGVEVTEVEVKGAA
jgi:hypothetical protein